MTITLNNRTETFDVKSISLEDLIKLKNYTFKMLITKINDTVIRREERNQATVHDGDVVIILHLVSGG